MRNFAENFERNINKIRDLLVEYAKCPQSLIVRDLNGIYRQFTIFDPKERLISAPSFRYRVIHHAIMNVCESYFERRQIYDSYANRKDKGTYKALERILLFHRKYKWCVKMDIRKYFDSIDHDILKWLLSILFPEVSMQRVFSEIIDGYPLGIDGRPSGGVKGLPIGNLTSQHFANFYLSSFDHYVKEKLQIKGYVRYMDDMFMFGDDRSELLDKARKSRDFLEKRLNLKLKVFLLKKNTDAMEGLGYKFAHGQMFLGQRSMRRFRHKLLLGQKMYDEGKWNENEMFRHVHPMLAFLMKAVSAGYRRKVMKTI